MDDETVLTATIRGLPSRLHAPKDDVTNRKMKLSTAVIYLQRAEANANISDGNTVDHSALVAYERGSNQASTSEWRMANRPADWVTPPAHLKCP